METRLHTLLEAVTNDEHCAIAQCLEEITVAEFSDYIRRVHSLNTNISLQTDQRPRRISGITPISPVDIIY